MIFLIHPIIAYNQDTLYFFEAWSSTDGEADNFFNNIVSITDSDNNVYVAASTLNEYDHYDLLVTKYDRYGVEVWSETYNETNAGDAIAGGITLDGSNNVIITGTVYVAANDYDLYVIKYNSSGTLQWSETYDGTYSVYDGGKALICDGSNNIYVTGGTFESATHSDIVTIKYNSSGVEQWVSTFDNDDLHDGGTTIGFYNPTTLIVSGPSQVASNQWEYAVIRYSTSTGSELSSMITSSSGSTMDDFSDLAIDEDENIYLVGSVMDPLTGFFDYKTFKLDADLNIVWEETYAGDAEKDDKAHAVGVDGSGNVYVSGFSYNDNEDKDIVTIKYNSSGVEQWTEKYDDLFDDEAWDLVIDEEDNIFIAGYTTHLGKKDFFTLMYDSDGEAKWEARHNGIYNKNDVAKNIKLDGDGNLLVSGLSETTSATTYLTVKYVRHETVIPPDEEPLSTAFYYVENRDQVVDTEQELVEGLKFYNQQNSPSLFFFDDKISFTVASIDTSPTTIDTMFRVDMGLDSGGGRSTRVMPMDKRQDYYNFYLGHIPEGREQVPLYDRLIYPGVFEGIDLMMASNGAGAKYYFICKPGSEPDDIELNFSGQTSLGTSGGDLIIGTVLQDIVLPEPSAYQIDGNGDPASVAWTPAYSIDGGEATITSGSYNTTQDLVFQINFDPPTFTPLANENIEWSTYYGEEESNPFIDLRAGDLDVDEKGNTYHVGTTENPDFPVSTDPTYDFMGGFDAYILKFGFIGNRIWATFYGGSVDSNGDDSDDTAAAVNAKDGQFVYFAGSTNSTDLPLMASGSEYIDDGLDANGNSDIDGGPGTGYIAKLNREEGVLAWATYFGDRCGGSGISTVELNNANGIVVVGNLFDIDYNECDFPEVSNGISYSDGNGIGNAFIAEFSNEHQLLWSSLFGNSCTLINDVVVDENDNIFITGGDCGTPSPLIEFYNVGNGYMQQNNLGAAPAIIAKFDEDRVAYWSTYFSGPGIETGLDLAINSEGKVYLLGHSNLDSPIPLKQFNGPGSPYYDSVNDNDDNELFIARFSNEGDQEWTTYFGGSNQEPGSGDIAIDGKDNVYIIGTTNSADLELLELQDAYYQEKLNQPDPNEDEIDDGTYDVFILTFNKNLEQSWTTLFGGYGVPPNGGDHAVAMALYLDQFLFMTGTTNSDNISIPTENPGSGAWYEPAIAGYIDLFISKFNIIDLIITSSKKAVKEENKIALSPNPTYEYINIQIQEQIEIKEGWLTVYNSLGQELTKISIQSNQTQLNTKWLPNGTYFMKIIFDDHQDVEKFIKASF